MGLKIQFIYLNFSLADSAGARKKLSSVKGSKQASGSRILMPLPVIRRSSPWSKAAIILRNQDYAAFAGDPMKRAMVKGSKYPKKSRMCCLYQRPEEARLGQRQQMSWEIKNLLPLPETRRNTFRSKAANILRNQESVAFAEDMKCLMIEANPRIW